MAARRNRAGALADEARELMRSVHPPAIGETKSPSEEMRDDFMDFFKGRIAAVDRAERAREKAYHAIEDDIDGGDLTFEQKLAALMRLSRDSNELSESLVSMFRPTGAQGSAALADIFQSGQSDKFDAARAFEGYSSEDLRRIDETFKVIRDIVECGGTPAVDGGAGAIPAKED